MRAQQQKDNGHESVPPKRRKKVVEQRFDDCGEDLTSLLPTKDFLVLRSSSDEAAASADEALQAALPQLNAFAQWALASSMSDG